MLRCIAVDDEPLAVQLLSDYIRKVAFLELVATCGDAFEATRVLQEKTVDLIFMDIQMPGLTGLQFIQSLPRRPMVILVTAYKKFASEGFDLDVVDYLIKPVGLDRFMKACFKAQELYQLRHGAPADYFFVNVDYSLVKVLFSDIVYIEGSGDYVKIHLSSAPRPLLVRMSTKAMEGELPSDRFLRIHKSYIVSKDGVTAVRKNSVFIGSLELPVGETYRESVRGLTGREL
ncbi:MAG TPA: LytTR family DNA-binding domain-containing protein [Dinghuibacter sp.]|jgi:DNA-binding LytR/AlgR family response regulator|uniref:LytR/AlgR family response regulator transcription factor n=1 Tax=Dinghuibacter sp. TaxID=2024697 RepID=UPI002CBB731F|nr:LytTR family DNA-binding domain-containing protein [Dinghuibacter sp.]HTJ10485.1 LytTR family DNA-binding domain-containing protein [Dinghuibacter sp.]